jgi:hypothetical protein
MSKIALTPNATGTGVFTISSPATSTDRTLTLPDEAGTVLTSASSLASANLTGTVTVSGSNVGIGTSSPRVKLDLRSDAVIAAPTPLANAVTSGVFAIGDSVGSVVGLQLNGSSYDTYIQSRNMGAGSAAYNLLLQPLGGNVLVAKSSDNNDVGCSLRASGAAYFVCNSNAALLVNRLGSDGTVVQIYNDSNGVGSISVSGASTAYNTSSDYRLKTDAQPMTGASDRVLALKPINFAWIASGDRVDGFLAHEAQAIVPECVTGTKDAMRDEEYEVTAAVLDADGMVVTEAVMGTRSVPDMQGIDQSKLVPLLTAALQEALNKIEAMETRLAALEAV